MHPPRPPISPADGAPSNIKSIAPYRPGKPIDEVAREYDLDAGRIIKLASNENPLGMPDSARAAIEAALGELGRYPDGNAFALKAAIAASSVRSLRAKVERSKCRSARSPVSVPAMTGMPSERS